MTSSIRRADIILVTILVAILAMTMLWDSIKGELSV